MATPTPVQRLIAETDALIARLEAGADVGDELREALSRLIRADERSALKRICRLWPDQVAAHVRLGEIFWREGGAAVARRLWTHAHGLAPDHPAVLWHLGQAAEADGDDAEAERLYRAALAAEPDLASAHHDLGMLLLRNGRFAEGWAEHEWRTLAPDFRPDAAEPDAPRWTGGPPPTRLLVRSEQGHGDIVQFSRFLPRLADDGVEVVARVPDRMIRLLGAIDPRIRFVGRDAPVPAVDGWCHLLSLPHLIGLGPHGLGLDGPLLRPEPARVDRWARELAARPRPWVGLCWQGNPTVLNDRSRSIPTDTFMAVARGGGATFVSLQRDPVGRWTPPPPGLVDLGTDLDAGGHAFADTVAVMASLDLIVTTDTVTAHLAGSLARPTWVALRAVADWRWFRDTDRSPWYPTMRLHRQTTPGDWTPVLGRIADDLADLAR